MEDRHSLCTRTVKNDDGLALRREEETERQKRETKSKKNNED